MKSITNYNNKDLYLEVGKYPNGRLAILLNDSKGDLWDDLTYNLPNKELEDNQIFINPRIDNNLIDQLCDTGVFLNTYRTEDYDYRVLYVNNSLLKNYTENYKIEIWETEYDRDNGEGYIYNKTFNDFKEALIQARRLYDKNNLASIEILNEFDEAMFCKDDESEEFYFKNNKISLVDKEIVDMYINNWMDHKELPIKENKLYCKVVGSGYLTIDNSSGECYVEEFDNEKQAQKWLLGKEKEEILEDEVTL